MILEAVLFGRAKNYIDTWWSHQCYKNMTAIWQAKAELSRSRLDSQPDMDNFFSVHYQEHNEARLEHLQSLGLPISGCRVLELGSGPGDHTAFYLSRGCQVVAVDARKRCLEILAQRFPTVRCVLCDLNTPDSLLELDMFDVVHCYGILYHLEEPERLIRLMGAACSGFAIVETCVCRAKESTLEFVDEIREDCTQSLTGRASRPSRKWVFETLGRYFPYVYQTKRQPSHPEFPTDWNDLGDAPALIRSIFVSSKHPLLLPSLSAELLDVQGSLGLGHGFRALEHTAAERLAAMREKDEEISRLAAELDARGTVLNGVLGQLEAAGVSIHEKDLRADALERAAAERLAAMREKDEEISRLAAELDARGAVLNGVLGQLEAAGVSIHEKDLRADALEQAAAERLAAMREKDEEILRLSAELDARETVLRSTLGQLQSTGKSIREKDDLVSGLERGAAERNAAFREKG